MEWTDQEKAFINIESARAGLSPSDYIKYLLHKQMSPKARNVARRKGLEFYSTGIPCLKCGTLAKRFTKTGKCCFCVVSRPPSRRQAAIAAGQTWYVPESPCKHCGTLSERNVHNGQCRGCKAPTERQESPDVAMMKAQPDLIIERDQAEALGMKVYRTGDPCRRGHRGYRYVSTGNCIECLRG